MTDEDVDRLRILRGRYIDKAVDIESRIDHVIGQFFQVNGRHAQEFQWWVLNDMPLGSKIRALRSIADELATDVEVVKLWKSLEAMVARRNAFAHRRFQDMVVMGDEGRHDGGVIQHPRRPRTRADQFGVVDLDEFDQYLAELDDLVVPLTNLLAAAMCQWPYTSDTGGVVTHHPGTLAQRDDQ